MKRTAITLLGLLFLAVRALAAPGVGFSPTSISFGSETVGVTSGTQTITVTNTGSTTLTFSSAATLTGTNAADFAVSTSSTCFNGVNVPSNGTCSIMLTFNPSATGSRTATVSISDNASGSPHTAGISGTGIAPTTNQIVLNCPTAAKCGIVGQITMTMANTSPPPVSVPPTVTVTPTISNLSTTGTQQYTATVTNDPSNLGVSWSIVCLAGPAMCGSVFPLTSGTGVPVTYTAPASTPNPNTVTITATSVLNPQVASSAQANITVTAPPPATAVIPCGPNFVTAASTNVFSCPGSQGSAPVVAIMGGPSNVISGVTASGPAGTFNLMPACPTSGSCFSNVGGGLAAVWFGVGLPSGLTTYTVNLSSFGNDLQAVIYDARNITGFDNAVAGGSGSCGTTPSQNITTQSAGLIITENATLSVTGANAPFNFVTALNGNTVGGTAYNITSAAGTYTPTWTESAAGCALYTAAFIGGAVTPTVSVAVAPTSFSVATSATKVFTPTVINGSKGVNWTLSGSGCSGSTCGTLSASTTASGVPVTYTAPGSVPSPATVTLTATSIDDNTKTAAATITVTAAPVVGVTVAPTSASVVANATQTFAATVANGTLNTVNWTLSGAGCSGSTCGTVSPTSSSTGASVTYTAPASAPSPAAVSLTATSVDDGTKSASATITVTSPVITVSVSPAGPVTMNAGGATSNFTYTVVNSGSGATWTITCSLLTCGSLSSTTAATTTYTSPATNNPLTVTLTAASVANPSIVAMVTINVNPVSTSTSCGSSCPAFLAPSGASADLAAQGGGAATPGGRGGKVYEITQTADSNGSCSATSVGFTNCSYRQCYMDTQGVGARYCVFRIAGIFPVTSGGSNGLRTTTPFMTVLGQTAPGEVILGGSTTSGALAGISTHDIVIRYVTMSPDNPNMITGPDGGTTSAWIVNCSNIFGPVTPSPAPPSSVGCFNIVLDHITLRWSGNKSWITTSNFTPQAASGFAQYSNCVGGNAACGVGPNFNITTQWTLMYEPEQGHPVGWGTATDEGCVGTLTTPTCLSLFEKNIDFHHNILMNISHRIPENSNLSTRWVNNVIYNWDTYANEWLGAETIDLINNKYIQGNLNATAQPHPVHFTENSPELCGQPSGYMAGNIFGAAGSNTVASNQWATLAVATNGEDAQSETDTSPARCSVNPNAVPVVPVPSTPGIPVPSAWQRSSPMAASNAFPIVPDNATQLDTILTPQIGNSQHLDQNGNWVNHRSNTDTIRINQYLNGGNGAFWPNGVTFSGVFFTQSAAAPNLPSSCPSGDTCQPFPTLQSAYQDIAPASGTPCTSTLHDGICDSWKTRYFPSGVTPGGVSTSSASFYKTTDPVTGIPYIEDFADGVVP